MKQKNKDNTATLYLVPNVISDGKVEDFIPGGVLETIRKLRFFIVEDVRTARRYLRKAGFTADFDSEVKFFILNKHTDTSEIPSFLEPAMHGKDMGIISESGAPCVADPGNAVVEIAHEANIKVVPLTGPSSILLSLMASGFNGQNFAFTGYLPIKEHDKIKRLKELENKIIQDNQTQIFIEAPYRNQKLMESILKNCKANLKLCIARDIGGSKELIQTKSLAGWKKSKPDINKVNTIFLLYK